MTATTTFLERPSLAAPVLLPLLARLRPQLAARAAEHDREGSFPHENFELLQAHGLVGITAPAAFGGSGASLATARQVIRAVAHADPATALVLTMTYLQIRQLNRPGGRWPIHLREKVSRDTVDRGALVNTLRVEPELGSPTRGGLPGTVARRQADGSWRLDGHKMYSTGAPGLTWLTVWARTEEGDGAPPRVGNFLVPRQAPGVRMIETWDHLGLRASGSHEVVFEQVALPADHAVDVRPQAAWAPDALTPADRDAFADQQAWMTVLLGTLYDAVAQAARDWTLDFVRQRAPGSLGAPLSTLPRVQETLGEIAALLNTNHLVLNQLTDTTDDGAPPAATDSGLAKYTVTHNAVAVVERALKLTGNHGLSRHNPLERHLRNVLCGPVHAPQDDALLVAAGRALLAQAAPLPAAPLAPVQAESPPTAAHEPAI
ncbi:acyl-CoA dehydrogenase family protein [Xylophilus sp. GOD-11R]|uniref:acyl-CoA dehydrogenase family protein n=1 Tax=Xylophilus sp. GOD-11R TaxID=3089814 RepID=UPI00298CE59B|nr:acyl-CoA dehydrogenase family protein [Xylophilus sp. GOD-11R]WPB55799.1 acyl-CoA dehydrogenase family protein [Xylophilus sp. GOD-11R]